MHGHSQNQSEANVRIPRIPRSLTRPSPPWKRRSQPEPAPMRVTLIDNYDSFTFNLVHYLGELGADVSVWRNDEVTVDEALADEPDAIVLSPGPCTPNEAGVCLDLVRAASKTTPMLGVCLGHQAIGQAFGGDVVRAPTPMHGKVSRISHN